MRPRSRRAILELITGGTLSLGAMGRLAAAATAATADAQPLAADLATFPAKLPAPALDLADLAGHRHDLAGHRGRVVVVNFWATWCGPCVAELASMERASQALRPRGVDVIAVNAGDSAERVRGFLDAHRLTFPVLLDPGTRAAAAWHVGALPTTYVVDGNGEIAAGALGGRDWDKPEIVAALTRLAAPAAHETSR